MLRKPLVRVIAAMSMLVLAFTLTACGGTTQNSNSSQQSDATPESTQPESGSTIRLATTTSTKDSGLLDSILPVFTDKTGIDVEVISVGSGEAMKLGENGEADVLLVHSPAAEKTFVENGFADNTGRLDVMYNDFVVLGPSDDPAGIKATAASDAVAAFSAIAGDEAMFISRADESGTHAKEKTLWQKAEITPSGDWYVEANSGMGAVIAMANERLAYTLSDRATWLSKANDTDLVIVSEKDPSGVLNNQYGVICVNPDTNSSINHDGAVAFQKWIVSPDTQALIAKFGVDTHGESLFTPNAAA